MVNGDILEKTAYIAINVLYLYSICVFLDQMLATKRPGIKKRFLVLLVLYDICVSMIPIGIAASSVTIWINVLFMFAMTLLYTSKSKWDSIVMTMLMYLFVFIVETQNPGISAFFSQSVGIIKK